MSRVTKDSLREIINKKEEDNAQLKQELVGLRTSFEEEKIKLKSEFDFKLSEKDQIFHDLQNKYSEKENQLNQFELKKLAKAYGDQEGEYKTQRKWWFKAVIWSAATLLTAIVVSSLFSINKEWYEKFEYFLADFVFLTFLIFSLKQFSSTRKLEVDYANRRTLAQSYQNILSSTDDEVIKNKFIEKTTDILCATSKVDSSESFTVPEKAFDALSQAVAALSKNK